MPFGKWSSFEDCVRDFVSQGKDEDSAKRICGALKARLEKEEPSQVFGLEGEVRAQKGNLIRGKAIHPIKIIHPEEWPDIRVYLEEELKKAAGSLAGTPLLLDHVYLLDGRVLEAKYEDGAVEYSAELNDERVLRWIRDGTIKNCSVEYEWDNLERVNGLAPRGIRFTGLALLKDFEPGDPEATVQLWEGIIRRLKEARGSPALREQVEAGEFVFYMVRDPTAFMDEYFSTVWIDRTSGIQGIYGRLRDKPENPRPMALLFMKAYGWNIEKIQSWIRDHSGYLDKPQVEPSSINFQVSLTPQVKQPAQPASLTSTFGAEKPSGEAVIEPTANLNKEFIGVGEILAELKRICYERVPKHWSYGAHLQNRRIRDLIRRLESQDSIGDR